jgi:hypothetical protein
MEPLNIGQAAKASGVPANMTRDTMVSARN